MMAAGANPHPRGFRKIPVVVCWLSCTSTGLAGKAALGRPQRVSGAGRGGAGAGRGREKDT